MMKLINTWIKDNYKEINKILVKLEKNIIYQYICYLVTYGYNSICSGNQYTLQLTIHSSQFRIHK